MTAFCAENRPPKSYDAAVTRLMGGGLDRQATIISAAWSPEQIAEFRSLYEGAAFASDGRVIVRVLNNAAPQLRAVFARADEDEAFFEPTPALRDLARKFGPYLAGPAQPDEDCPRCGASPGVPCPAGDRDF